MKSPRSNRSMPSDKGNRDSMPGLDKKSLRELKKIKERYSQVKKNPKINSLIMLKSFSPNDIRHLKNTLPPEIKGIEDKKSTKGEKENPFFSKKILTKSCTGFENGWNRSISISNMDSELQLTDARKRFAEKYSHGEIFSSSFDNSSKLQSILKFESKELKNQAIFNSIIQYISSHENLIENYCQYAEELKIKMYPKRARFLFNLWKELYVISIIKEEDFKKIIALEIYKEYMLEKEKYIDGSKKFKRNLKELKKKININQMERLNIELEEFNQIKLEIENEISNSVFQFSSENQLATKSKISNLKKKKCFDLLSIIQHLYLRNEFFNSFVLTFILFHKSWINSDDLISSIYNIYHNSDQYENPSCIRSS